MHVEHAQVVRAPRERVFAAWIDYEAWPSLSGLFTRVDVLERHANTVRVGAQIKLMGRKSTRTERHILTPPRDVRVEGETEGATNTTLWTFEPIPDGTRLTAAVDVELGALTKLLGPLAKRQLQSMLRDWMQGLARYVESGERR